ncbi:metallophosphoesterase [Puniceibacterium sp. IMCC21224]|uniref:metallophosphoesterase n=1 Tax=Puniceibacterium sp. IMCC21224 TaxID=1618204 RepID=UPI00064DBD06|nr:metallophosphoesterase [Puniceibacterium sp. IMCC21224]KMK68024.1 Calcineurin-like phosphoesterase [Puniceibacterium sp. IMCC21224]
MRNFFRKRVPTPTFTATLAPEQAFCAIGDIHGCDDILAGLLDRLGSGEQSGWPVICVGDYIDRGDQSAQVLRRLHHLQTTDPDALRCLMGNHERMMIDFLDAPAESGPRWQRHGGLQTLASFRVSGVPETAPDARWVAARDALRGAMGPHLEDWLRNLPLHWRNGNVFVTHAAADPALPVEGQGERTLLWGHPQFDRIARADGIWVVHGHTIVASPTTKDGRIAIDTGAYATGRLTAAAIGCGDVAFKFGEGF